VAGLVLRCSSPHCDSALSWFQGLLMQSPEIACNKHVAKQALQACIPPHASLYKKYKAGCFAIANRCCLSVCSAMRPTRLVVSAAPQPSDPGPLGALAHTGRFANRDEVAALVRAAGGKLLPRAPPPPPSSSTSTVVVLYDLSAAAEGARHSRGKKLQRHQYFLRS
jgi:hypothetical protein